MKDPKVVTQEIVFLVMIPSIVGGVIGAYLGGLGGFVGIALGEFIGMFLGMYRIKIHARRLRTQYDE